MSLFDVAVSQNIGGNTTCVAINPHKHMPPAVKATKQPEKKVFFWKGVQFWAIDVIEHPERKADGNAAEVNGQSGLDERVEGAPGSRKEAAGGKDEEENAGGEDAPENDSENVRRLEVDFAREHRPRHCRPSQQHRQELSPVVAAVVVVVILRLFSCACSRA